MLEIKSSGFNLLVINKYDNGGGGDNSAREKTI